MMARNHKDSQEALRQLTNSYVSDFDLNSFPPAMLLVSSEILYSYLQVLGKNPKPE